MKPSKCRVVKGVCALLICALLSACGGYANTPNSKSGIETYGVIDVGIQR
ncbi:hypothetical protein [uncultured Oxalicibacterium sp.]|nr:hypothetical protein [uncultured Oxalicibacterium sp.]